jgi:hypothetical protein
MRVTFYDDDLKGNLEKLATGLDISLNRLVNFILSAEFSEKDKKSLQLLKNLIEK